MPGSQPALFELRAGPFVRGELRVLELSGREALSKLFSFEIMFDSDVPAWELEAGLLGQPATLVMQAPRNPPRVLFGTAAWVRVENAWKDDHAARRYTLRLVPTMWKLGKRVNTRIFQDQSAADVITTVMVESGLAVRFDLSTQLPVRDYCVQYEESDLAFITRLLAEAGCYFYFEPPVGILEQLGLGAEGAVATAVAGAVSSMSSVAGADVGTVAGVLGFVDTLVVSDRASFYPAIAGALEDQVIGRVAGAVGNPVVSNLAATAPTLVHRDPEGMVIDGERTVTRFALRRSLRSSAVMLRDYLYERPLFDATGVADPSDIAAAASKLGAAALNDVGAALRGGASGSVGAAAFDLLATMPADFKAREVYRHQSDFSEPDAQKPNAQRQLEQHRQRALQAEGKSFCRRLSSGHKFTLAEHEEARLNRVWVVTGVKHRGITIEWARLTGRGDERLWQYQNTFTCAPAELTIRPKRPPRRLMQVADTAVVVGPDGQEVYTDAMGRIKVQFHWN